MDKFSDENLNLQDLANNHLEQPNIELTEDEINYIKHDAEVTYELYKRQWHDRLVRRLKFASIYIAAVVAIALIIVMFIH